MKPPAADVWCTAEIAAAATRRASQAVQGAGASTRCGHVGNGLLVPAWAVHFVAWRWGAATTLAARSFPVQSARRVLRHLHENPAAVACAAALFAEVSEHRTGVARGVVAFIAPMAVQRTALCDYFAQLNVAAHGRELELREARRKARERAAGWAGTTRRA